jgi:hypothetical protein
MFHPTRVEIDIGDTGHPRPASKSPLGHGAAIGLGPAKRRPRHDVLPRIAAARGWRATFMSI